MRIAFEISPPSTALAFIAKPTPQLRAAVAQMESVLPPADFTAMLGAVRSAFAKYTAKLLEYSAGVPRAHALHQLMERELQAVATVPVSCRQGCFGCCHYEVEVTEAEAQILMQRVQDGLTIDRLRLQEQAGRERQGPEWLRLAQPQNRCVFVGADGGCRVYEDRPAICRKHLVTSPAAACITPGADVTAVPVLMAEILLSAAVSLEEVPCASLPKMLHAALATDERDRAFALRTDPLAKPSLPPGRVSVGEKLVRLPAA